MNAEQLLRRLGLSGRLKGFGYAAYMIEQAAKDPSAVRLITKSLYPETARHFQASVDAVERDLRTLVYSCWSHGDRAFLEVVAGRHIPRRPTNSEFLDLAAAYLRSQGKV